MRYILILATCLLTFGQLSAEDLKLEILSEFGYINSSSGEVSNVEFTRGQLNASDKISNISDDWRADFRLDFTKNASGGFDTEVSRAFLTREVGYDYVDTVSFGKLAIPMGKYISEDWYDLKTVSVLFSNTFFDYERTGAQLKGSVNELNLNYTLNLTNDADIGKSYGGDVNFTLNNVNVGVSAVRDDNENRNVMSIKSLTTAYYISSTISDLNLSAEIFNVKFGNMGSTPSYTLDANFDATINASGIFNVGLRYGGYLDKKDSDLKAVTPYVSYAPNEAVKFKVEYNKFTNSAFTSSYNNIRAYLGFKISN